MDLIPLDAAAGLPYFDLQAPLDGVTYTFSFRWNVRASAWFLDIWDEQGVTLFAAGVRVVVNYPLCAYFTGRKPPGHLIAVDTSGRGLDPGIDDIGGSDARVKIYYMTSAELALLG
jgi:hypothetical protein